MPSGHGSVRVVYLIFSQTARSASFSSKVMSGSFAAIFSSYSASDAVPKLRITVKNRVEFFVESVNLAIKLICVLIRHTIVKLVNLRFQSFDLGKVRKQNRFLLFGQSAHTLDEFLVGCLCRAGVIKILLIQFKGHVRLVCRNLFIILIVDASPKL